MGNNQNRGNNHDPYEMTKDWFNLSEEDFKIIYGIDWTPPDYLIERYKKEISIREDKKGEIRP